MTTTAPVGLTVTGIQVQTAIYDGILSGDVTVTYATAAGGNMALYLGSLHEPLSPAFLHSPALQALNTVLAAMYALWVEQSAQV